MFELLLMIIGCYAMAAVLVHLAFWVGRRRRQVSKQFVFIANHNENNMEWYLRSLKGFSRWMGRDVRLTLIDRGVSDETRGIVDRWKRAGHTVHVQRYEAARGDYAMPHGKRSHDGEDKAFHMMWMLQAEGIVTEADHAVIVDLQNPADLSKMPF
ncbi:hypothetical protein M6D81_06945 [Paenibacillus sp. J5C_2022]|uniref:hypothetical protein n=1 Tax=Paenibacillus sp. J5C2022 TaxID=2977129 RepID=UPI0021CF1412|nr:hypothetical protein [Paenibacillus sp. J5C2022]MCU6708450.1 hypothetical protein [Paenibacillus sp. J5C2022]